MNSEANFTQDDWIDCKLALVPPEPLDDRRVRCGPGGLAEHIRVDKVVHSVSVDSDSTGTKKSFSGQDSSQSTSPSFAGGLQRTSRYWPRSMRSTSNCCPGSMASCRRSSAGSTIWPFEETVVFIQCKISSYISRRQRQAV